MEDSYAKLPWEGLTWSRNLYCVFLFSLLGQLGNKDIASASGITDHAHR